MSFKEILRLEMHVVLHGQSARFRIIKWLIIFAVTWILYLYAGLAVPIYMFFGAMVLGVVAHFALRYLTHGWTRNWGPWQSVKSIDSQTSVS